MAPALFTTDYLRIRDHLIIPFLLSLSVIFFLHSDERSVH